MSHVRTLLARVSDLTRKRRLRICVLSVILLDIVMTAIKQPHGYWLRGAYPDERNLVARHVMVISPVLAALFAVAYLLLAFGLMKKLPRFHRLVVSAVYAIGHVAGVLSRLVAGTYDIFAYRVIDISYTLGGLVVFLVVFTALVSMFFKRELGVIKQHS